MIYVDKTMLEQMREQARRARNNPNHFTRMGDSNIFQNNEGRKLERVTVDGSIIYREKGND